MYYFISDTVECSCKDLFIGLLKSNSENLSSTNTYLLCFEYPPEFYTNSLEKTAKIVTYDFFSDPCGWNEKLNLDVNNILSDKTNLSEKLVFVDSLNRLIERLGFYNTYRLIKNLKTFVKSLVCLVHNDLLDSNELEKFEMLSMIQIKLQTNNNFNAINKKNCKVIEIKSKKPNGKINSQLAEFYVDDNFTIHHQIHSNKQTSSNKSVENDFEGLTTFKLGLKMSENEKKAKEQLILPYLRYFS